MKRNWFLCPSAAMLVVCAVAVAQPRLEPNSGSESLSSDQESNVGAVVTDPPFSNTPTAQRVPPSLKPDQHRPPLVHTPAVSDAQLQRDREESGIGVSITGPSGREETIPPNTPVPDDE